MSDTKKRVKIGEKPEQGSVGILATDDMSDSESRKLIYEDMMNLEKTSSWERLDDSVIY